MNTNEYWMAEVLVLLDDLKKTRREQRRLNRRVKSLEREVIDSEIDVDTERTIAQRLEDKLEFHEWLKDEHAVALAKNHAILDRQIGLRAIDRLTSLTDDEREDIARLPYPELHKLTTKMRATIKRFIKLNGS